MRIGKKDDLTLEPSEELNRETLELMEAHAANAPVRRKKTRLQRMLSCAALIGAMFMLMGAGYRVLSYIVYVPGQGILQQTAENVYILKKAVEAGDHYIEAISMLPITEGEQKGQWKLTLLTNESYDDAENETVGFTAPDGTAAVLRNEETIKGTTRYTGTIANAGAGTGIVQLEGKEYPVAIIRLSDSVYANYRYPTDEGITAVIFPMAEGSNRLVMDFSLQGVSEDLLYWAQHGKTVTVSPLTMEGFVLTDTEGNTYRVGSGHVGRADVPLEDPEQTLLKGLEYRTETMFYLDRRLEAPLAKIECSNMKISITGIQDTISYTLTIPAEGETVTFPEDTILLDSHGLRDTLLRIESGAFTHFIDEYHAFTVFRKPLECTFPENVTQINLIYDFIIKKDPQKVQYMCLRSGPAVEGYAVEGYEEPPSNWQELPYDMFTVYPIMGDGTRTVRQRTARIGYGDTVYLTPENMNIHITGNWDIDFTKANESVRRIPEGIIRRKNN